MEDAGRIVGRRPGPRLRAGQDRRREDGRSRSPSAASCSAARSSRATSCTSRSRTASAAARRASGPRWATAPCPAAGSRSAGPPRSSARASSRSSLDWLDEHPDARLVAIDTLQRVRARGDARRNAYEVDVEDLARLQDIFKDRAVGLLIVHHSKKDAGDDFLASVSGTYGITGSADTTLVIQRKRLETFGKLVVTGRDVQASPPPSARLSTLHLGACPGAPGAIQPGTGLRQPPAVRARRPAGVGGLRPSPHRPCRAIPPHRRLRGVPGRRPAQVQRDGATIDPRVRGESTRSTCTSV